MDRFTKLSPQSPHLPRAHDDESSSEVIEAPQCVKGKAIVNSTRQRQEKFVARPAVPQVRAAVVVMAFDEAGRRQTRAPPGKLPRDYESRERWASQPRHIFEPNVSRSPRV